MLELRIVMDVGESHPFFKERIPPDRKAHLPAQGGCAFGGKPTMQ